MKNIYIQQLLTSAQINKYTKWYINIINNALLRGNNKTQIKKQFGYIELHHILPKSFKPKDPNNKINLVFLTAKEHFIVHICLTKMFSGNLRNKMIHALWRMKSKNKYQQLRYFSSRIYSQIRQKFFIKGLYIRLYKNVNVKYVLKENINLLNELINNGWSKSMPDEYKVGRVGNMKGKKHSKETKLKMSLRQKGKEITHFKTLTEQEILQRTKKATTTKLKKKQDDPVSYAESYKRGAAKRSEMYKNGILSMKGKNNPRFGKKCSEETKLKIKEGIERSRNKGLSNKDLYDLYLKDWSNTNLSYRKMALMLKKMGFRKSGFSVHCIINQYSINV